MNNKMNFEQELLNEAQVQGINRYVVGATIFLDFSILLLERPKDDFMGGIYELPSGKVEEGESLITALHREVKEETGIIIDNKVKYLGFFDYTSKSGKKTRQFNFCVTLQKPIEVELHEHTKYEWANPSQLDSYPITDSVKEVIGQSIK